MLKEICVHINLGYLIIKFFHTGDTIFVLIHNFRHFSIYFSKIPNLSILPLHFICLNCIRRSACAMCFTELQMKLCDKCIIAFGSFAFVPYIYISVVATNIRGILLFCNASTRTLKYVPHVLSKPNKQKTKRINLNRLCI